MYEVHPHNWHVFSYFTSMADDGHAMRELMGFSSFGRPRKRARRHGDRARGTDTSMHVEGSRTARGELAHVVRGTIVEADGERLPATSVRVTAQGIALLLNSGQDNVANLTEALSDLQNEQQSGEEAAPSRLPSWSLPAPSMELLKRLEDTKTRFGSIERQAFVKARRETNPFEAIGRHRFINRSAMKMANLDFLFEWTQTHVDRRGKEPFTFADACGGPGGFSEYLLWRMQHHDDELSNRAQGCPIAVGFGITLKGAPWCDWKVQAEEGTSTEFHICTGADGTGDLYKVENIRSFRDTVLERFSLGVHIVVADGGFPDARNQSNQELMMTRLVLAESLTMLWVLRVGGSFLCKTFELSSPLMLQLLWILHNCFEEVTIVKPVTSRPASSERYVVAQKLQPNLPLENIRSELESLVRALDEEDPRQQSLLSTPMPHSSSWLEFVTQASDRTAQQQIAACEKIVNLASCSPDSDRYTEHIRPDDYTDAWGV